MQVGDIDEVAAVMKDLRRGAIIIVATVATEIAVTEAKGVGENEVGVVVVFGTRVRTAVWLHSWILTRTSIARGRRAARHQCMDMAKVMGMYRRMDTDTARHMDIRKVMHMYMDMGEGTGVAVGRWMEAAKARDVACMEGTVGVMGSMVSLHQLARMGMTTEGLHPAVVSVTGGIPTRRGTSAVAVVAAHPTAAEQVVVMGAWEGQADYSDGWKLVGWNVGASLMLFEKQKGKKGCLVCKACRVVVWQPDCMKDISNCAGK